MKGRLITFEGGEGAGKTTVIRRVSDELKSRDVLQVLLREPGGTELGNYMRAYLLQVDRSPLCPKAELMMFNAARAQLVNDIIRPALESGHVVLCDRFFDSTSAYQGYARGLPLEEIRAVNLVATSGLEPDMTLLLDLDPRTGVERAGRRGEMSSFDLELLEFHHKVRAGFLELARLNPHRFQVIDAGKEPGIVAEEAIRAVFALLESADDE